MPITVEGFPVIVAAWQRIDLVIANRSDCRDRQQFKAAYPEYKVVPYNVAQAAAAIIVWRDAFNRAQSLDQEKVREALTGTDLKTFYGGIKIAPDGSNPGKDVVLRQIQGGQYKVVWPEDVAAAQLEYPRSAQY